jgi:hypothetical protein
MFHSRFTNGLKSPNQPVQRMAAGGCHSQYRALGAGAIADLFRLTAFMRLVSRYLVVAVVAVLVGCQQQHAGRSVRQFEFLQPGMAITDVTNRVGSPDRESGSGQVRWEYDLADGSQMVITPEFTDYKSLSTWRVAYFGQYRGTNWLWSKPGERK